MDDILAIEDRLMAAVEKYERKQMKPRPERKWGMLRRRGCGRQVPMRKPSRAKLMKVWCGDDIISC